MENKDFLNSEACEIFYDWMGMHENGTFKEGAEGDNFLAYNLVKIEIADEIRRNVERMWEEMQENDQDSMCDWWEGVTQYAHDLIEKICEADDDEREAIFKALKYDVMDIDFSFYVDVCHKVEVRWHEDDIEVEIREEASSDIFSEWAHIDEYWSVKKGYSEENLNAYYEVESQLVGMVVNKIEEMSQYDTEMEWEDCDKWLEEVISRECRANEREREAIFDVVMDYVTNQYPFEEADGWIERDGDKTIIHHAREEE